MERNFDVKFSGEDVGLNNRFKVTKSDLDLMTKKLNDAAKVSKISTGKISNDFRKLGFDLKNRAEMIGRAWNKTFGRMRLGGMAGLGAGFGVYALGKSILDLDSYMARLRISTGASLEEVMKFKQEMLKISYSTGASTDAVMELHKSLAASTHDFKFANDELGFLSSLMQASGVSGEELGKAMGEIHMRTGLAGKDLATLGKKLYAFGQVKGVAIDFAGILPKVPELVKTARSIYGKNANIGKIGDIIMTQMFTGANIGQAMLESLHKAGHPAKQYLAPLGLNLGQMLADNLSASDIFKRIQNAMDKMHVSNAERQRMWGNLLGVKGGVGMERINDMVKALTELDENRAMDDAATQAKTLVSALNRLTTVAIALIDSEFGKKIGKWVQDFKPDEFDAMVKKWKTWAEILAGILISLKLIQGAAILKTAFGAGAGAIGAGTVGGGAVATGAKGALTVPAVAGGVALGLGGAYAFQWIRDKLENPSARFETSVQSGLSKPWETLGGEMSPSLALKRYRAENAPSRTVPPSVAGGRVMTTVKIELTDDAKKLLKTEHKTARQGQIGVVP